MPELAPADVASTMLILEVLLKVVGAASATPLAINRVRVMAANNSMVRHIGRPAFRKGAG